jgi:uncharacterized protein (DUF2249 family)
VSNAVGVLRNDRVEYPQHQGLPRPLLSRRHGNTLIGTLRKTYGPAFAPGLSDRDKLSDVLHKLDEPSLSKLVRDHDAGRLHEITRGDRAPQPGVDHRHRNKDGEISKKHANTLIETLRKTYGPAFTPGFSDRDKLSGVLHKLDEPSLSKLVEDHDAGRLHESTRGDRTPQPGLDHRHRNKDGEIGRKHGTTLIGTLRKTYGPAFAPGLSDQDKLSDVLHKLDEPSLSKLVQDHDAGHLHAIIRGDRAPRFDVVHIFGRAPDDPQAWRVQLRDGTIANISVTTSSSATIDETIFEYHDVFKRLADE